MIARVRLAVAVAIALACCTAKAPTPAPSPAGTTSSPTPLASPGFTLVGHDPLLGRGMNAGLAVHGRYAYVGSRTDSSASRPHAGVLVVDVADLGRPDIVGEFGGAPPGLSSRELRIWPEQNLLVILYLPCSASMHRCSGTAGPSLRFYDIRGASARTPELLYEYRTPFTPHEMFLWDDPQRAGRALLYVSTDTPGDGLAGLFVLDVSRARERSVTVLATWSGNRALGDRLHSVGVSRDGTRAYLAHLGGGFAVLDTGELARAKPDPEPRLMTEPSRAVRWSPGPHSAIEIPGSSLVVTTDEVYGGEVSCPWGWVRLIDVADPGRPRIAGELRAEQNRPQACPSAPRTSAYSFSSHNPTVVAGVVLVSWHAAGLVAASVRQGMLVPLATFTPMPEERVATEDPRLTTGSVRVAMWSTPILAAGLVYVVDIRNGLYVLRLEGLEGADPLRGVTFAEGNSNVGR